MALAKSSAATLLAIFSTTTAFTSFVFAHRAARGTKSTAFAATTAVSPSAAMTSSLCNVKKVPAEALYVSEPNPAWFGNAKNEHGNAHWTNPNWLKSRFHFSFAEYSSVANTNFGVMRVMNDDLVQPARGFGTHGHGDMEIVTYVVEGELTHKDSMGTSETLGPGSIQFMTAGTGIRHSEHNIHPEMPLRFIQTWIVPRARQLTPNYGSMRGSNEVAMTRRNQWAHLLSDNQADAETPVKIAQDCNMFATELDAGTTLALDIAPGRQAYLLDVEGSTTLAHAADAAEPVALDRHDAAEIVGDAEAPLKITAGEAGAHLIYFEMAADGSGRRDLH